MVEDEIVDEYLSEKLGTEDRVAFERHFLATPERHEKLRFGRAFHRHLSTRATVAAERRPALSASSRPFSRILFSPLRIGLAAVVIVGLAFGIWRVVFYQSEVEKGLLALNEAYSQQRPIEARISALTGYAPFASTRGELQSVNELSRRRAELTLSNAVADYQDAASHHALGNVYLANRQVDLAIAEFEQALKSAPNNPKIHNDLGAARLEAAKEADQKREPGKAFALLAQSLSNFDHGLQLNPNLLEALYNRALCLEQSKLTEKAKEAWQSYLEHDSSSKWADEARKHLQQLIGRSSGARKTPSELLHDFIVAFERGEDELAWRILFENREEITGRMIGPQLERAFISAVLNNETGRSNLLSRAHKYAGDLELKRGGDRFTRDLAQYYASSSSAQRLLLAKALKSLDDGYNSCLSTDYKNARAHFQSAQGRFVSAQNIWEAKTAAYWISYCDTQLDRISESLFSLKEIDAWCRRKDYKWLQAQTDEWIATNYSALSQHSESIRYHQRSLDLAIEISDTYQIARNLTALGTEYARLHQPNLSLGYFYRSLVLSSESRGSPRQAWRNLTFATSALFSFKYYEAALAVGDESLRLGEREFKDPSLSYLLHLHLAQIYSRLGRFEEGIAEANKGLSVAGSVIEAMSRQKATAGAFLTLAQVYRESNKNEDALRWYGRAIALYDSMKFDLLRYVAYKGRLLASISIGDEATVDQTMPVLLDMFEQYRSKIQQEQYRNSFFDNEQSVYDIAVEREYRKNNKEAAFNYAEASHGRSLLDALQGNTRSEATPSGEDRSSLKVSQPLSVDMIRPQLPDHLTVLMFTVLPQRLLIWRISKDDFSVSEKNITAESMRSDTLEYLVSLTGGESASPRGVELSKRLHQILIGSLEANPNNQERLCIIPDKFLTYLPFSSLISPDTGKYLIEKRPIFYAASLNVLLETSRAAGNKPRFDGPVLSVGDPSFDRDVYPNLRRLDGADREARMIAEKFEPSTFLVGPGATKSAFLRAAVSKEIIHFAGHYIVDESNPLQSRMLLAATGEGVDAEKSELTASEVAGHVFEDAKLIVLSACQTGIDKYYDGEGNVGLAHAFLEARIPLVVASQWAVDSDSTADLMISFYDFRKSGLPTIEALRAAQVKMLSNPNETYRQPYYWAAFECIGGGAEY